jgi:hypothetical protein
MAQKIPGLPALSELLTARVHGYPLKVHGGVIGMQLQRVIPKSNQASPADRQPANKNASERSSAGDSNTEQGKPKQ